MVNITNTLKSKEIQKLMKTGKIINLVMVFCFFSLKNPLNSVAYAVSKKFKTKPTKNKIKRQLRSVVSKTNDWPNGLNLILIAKKNYLNYSFEDIKKTLILIKEKINENGNT